MAKKFSQMLLSWLFKCMPWGVQETMFCEYCRSRGVFQTFRSLAERHRVQSIVIDGSSGAIEGSIRDNAIVATYARTGEWGKRTIGLLKSFFLNEGGIYIDVGANVGLTTVPIAANRKVRCIAFEPDPENFLYLKTNIIRQGVEENVAIHNIAIAEKEGISDLELSPHNRGDHRLRLQTASALLGENEWETVQTTVRRLDDVVDVGSERLAVKIDVQGAEPLVIEGGGRTLTKATLVVLEFSPYWMMRMGANPNVIAEFVSKFPYVAIADGEIGAIEGYQRGPLAAQQLLRLFDENKDKAVGAYWDIVARREI